LKARRMKQFIINNQGMDEEKEAKQKTTSTQLLIKHSLLIV